MKSQRQTALWSCRSRLAHRALWFPGSCYDAMCRGQGDEAHAVDHYRSNVFEWANFSKRSAVLLMLSAGLVIRVASSHARLA